MAYPDYWHLIEPIWKRVSIYDGEAKFLREFATAPERARNVLAAHWCQSEVCNGGFDQLFFNSTGVLVPEAIAAFDEIEMPQLAGVVSDAALRLGPSYPRDIKARRKLLKQFKPADWRTLDDRFYALIRVESGGFDAVACRYAMHA